MNNFLPITIKYRLQTWTTEHWKTHYKDKASEKVSKVIDLLRQVPDASHLSKRAKSVISDLSITPTLSPKPKEKKPFTKLHKAIQQKDIAAVKELIAKGVKIDKIKSKLTPLQKAVYENQIEIISLLLDNGAKIDLRSESNCQTALEIACELGTTPIVELLLQRGANPNPSQDNKSPLHRACQHGNLEMVRMLLKFKANIDAVDERGGSALFQAVMDENINLVQLLIDAGCDVNFQNRFDFGTALHEASSRGNVQILQLLLDNKGDVTSRDCKGNTPLHSATNKEIAALLLKKGADLEARNRMGKTPLLFACDLWSANDDLGQFLIEQGANIYDSGNQTLLYHALNLDLYQIARKLIERGEDLEKALKNFSPVFIFDSKKRLSFLKEQKYDFSQLIDKDLLFSFSSTKFLNNLLSIGVNLNVQDEQGNTPLHLENFSVNVQMMIEAGAKLDARNNEGNTPLHMQRTLPSIKALIDAGADLHIKNQKNETPFEIVLQTLSSNSEAMDILYLYLKQDLSLFDPTKLDQGALEQLMQKACKDNYEALALKLLSHGVKVDVPDKDKFTALDHALTQGHFDLLRTLIEKLGGSYKAFIEHKLLAHVFGLEGFSVFNAFKVDHEGFNYRLSAEMLALLGGEFLKDRREHKELFDILQEAPVNLNLSPAELMKKMDEKPVILFTGWDQHIIAIIFYKDMVLKCNRGSMSPTEGGGIEIFKMKNKEKLSFVLDDLQKQATSEEGRSLLYNRMNEDLNLEKEDVFFLKKQPVGNCGWSSAKAAFLGAAYLCYLKQELSDKKARIEGMRLFKEFTPFVREKVADYCVTNTENLDRF